MASFRLVKDVRTDTLGTREFYHRSIASEDLNLAGFVPGTNEIVQILVPSSASMKSNIVPLEDVSDDFSKLKPCRYTIKHEGKEVKGDIGLIAEEIEPLFPEFVRRNPESMGCTAKGVSYDKLVVLCIQQIQQLKEQNLSLQARLEDLERSRAPANLGGNV